MIAEAVGSKRYRFALQHQLLMALEKFQLKIEVEPFHRKACIVLIAGFESFNAELYRKAARLAQARCPELEIRVFSDRDLTTNPGAVETALEDASVFGSLLFDYDQVLWLRKRLKHIPIRLVFESAIELSLTQLGAAAIGDK